MTSPTSDRRLGLVGNTPIKAPVAVVATSNITQSGLQTIDGVSLASGDRVLCTAQTSSVFNGIWDVSSAAWTRSADADGTYDFACGSMVTISRGSHASQIWILTSADPISVGTSALTWSMNTSATFLSTLSASGGSALIGFLQAGSGAVARTAQDKLRDAPVTPADFGAVGNDTADDTVALQEMLAATIANRTAVLERGKTYKIASDELVMQDYSRLDGNGATLHFTHTNAGKRCLALGNGCVVENLTVNNTSGVFGTDGTYQTPIVVGVYSSLTVISNVKIRNVTISSLTSDGNGIAILGAQNVDIDSVTFPDSTTLGIGVLCHWASAGGVAGPTIHPRNIRINNIKCGSMSGSAGGALGQSLVFLSACYNIEVSDIYADAVRHGKGVTVYAGEFGYQYGTAVESSMGMCGITVKNVFGQYLIAAHVYGLNPQGAVSQIWPGSVNFDNVCGYGYGPTDTSSKGLLIENCDNVKIKNGTVSTFAQGIFLGGTVTDLMVEDYQILNSYTNGFDGTASTSLGEIELRNIRFVGTNQSAAANKADINVVSCTAILVEDCKFNSAAAQWNTKWDNTSTLVRLVNNRTLAVSATGPCHSIGSGTDTAICTLFSGNTSDAAPSGGIRGGQIFMPFAIAGKMGTNDTPWMATGVSMPDRGTWSKGSVCFIDAPTGGNPWAFTRLTSSTGNVLNTDWKSVGSLSTST